MLRFQVWAIQLETACLKLAELPEALAIVQAARRGASDSNRHSRASPGGKGKSRQPFGRQRAPNSARDQRQSDDRPAQVVGRTQRPRPQPQQRRGTKLQAKLDKRKARSNSRMRSKSSNRLKTLERDRFCQCRLTFLMCGSSVPPRVLCLP